MDFLDFLTNVIYCVLLLLGIGLALHFYGTKNYTYFTKQNVPFMKPIPFLGNMMPFLFRKRSFPEHIKWMYDELKGNSYGVVFQLACPYVMILDPELIKAVTVKDFDYFTDHKQVVSDDCDPIFRKTLFSLQGERWRDMRASLSPAFTSSKMKMMFHLMTECSKQLVDFLKKCCQNYTPDKVFKIEKDNGLLVVEMKDIFVRFGNDIIATTAFGISVDSLEKPSNDFYMMGKEATNLGGSRALVWIGYLLCPPLMKMLKISLFSERVTNFFKSLVLDTMATREREGIVRPDMLQLLMQAKKGTLEDETSSLKTKKIFGDDEIAAQVFQFFMAGFNSSATLLSFATNQLATHPDIQAHLQEEIDTTLKECGGDITYEAVHSMKYLDMVLSETLRLYPPGVALDRSCIRTYTLPTEPPLQIHPGDAIWLPVYGLHHDPKYFPDPERFDPERFSDENKHNIKPYTYIPFGTGPRSCIGNRFALMEAKVAIVFLLSHFNLKVVSRTPIPLVITKNGFNMTVDGGFWLGLEEKRTNQHIK